MKFLATFILVTMTCTNSKAQRVQHATFNPIQLKIAKENVSEDNDLDLSARLISKWQKPIAVPGDFTWGQLTAANLAFLLIGLQRKVGTKYKEVILDAKY